MATLSVAATQVNSKDPFNYATHFDSENLGNQAKATTHYFQSFVRQTFKGLIEIGKLLWEFYENCCRELGADRGRKAFYDWLASDQFGGSRYLADTAMALFPWYQNLPKALQRLVATHTDTWSISALKELPKLTYDLVEQLVKQGKQTTKSIRCAIGQGKRYLILGELVTEADWQLISEQYEIVGENLDSLRLEAQANAILNPHTGLLEVKTDDLTKALETFGYDLSRVLPKPKSQKRYTEEDIEQIRAQYQTQVEKLKQELAQKAFLEAENIRLRQRITELEQSPSLPSQKILQESEPKFASQGSDPDQLSQPVENSQRLELPLRDDLLFPGASVTVISDVHGRVSATGIVQNKNESGWWILLALEPETGQPPQIQNLKQQLDIYDCDLERLSQTQKSFQKRKKPQGFGLKSINRNYP
jgi:hypothetical protein